MSGPKAAVEKGMPMPTARYRSRFDWSALEVGDSYSADDPRIRDSAAYYRKRNPSWRYACRFDPADRRYRVWRVA